jgi:hypothetical protein
MFIKKYAEVAIVDEDGVVTEQERIEKERTWQGCAVAQRIEYMLIF